MILTSKDAAHKAWSRDYTTKGPALNHYQSFMRGFNEGVAHSLEKYFDEMLGKAPPPTEPIVPTIDTIRKAFCQMDAAERTAWYRLKKFIRGSGNPA